jgi:hypothetical protein
MQHSNKGPTEGRMCKRGLPRIQIDNLLSSTFCSLLSVPKSIFSVMPRQRILRTYPFDKKWYNAVGYSL